MNLEKLSQCVTISPLLWGAIGSLMGIFFAHYLTRSWQSKQWLLDRRKEEWRELLSTLTASFVTISQLVTPLALDADDLIRLNEARNIAQIMIRDRLFISREIEKLGLYNLWFQAVQKFHQDYDYIEFAQAYARINADIVEAATKGV